jgi:CRP-like cAMP-binding protein
MADGAIELAFARSALRRCALFALVDDVTLDTVCASLRVRRYRRNETIFHQGDPGDALYIVESGSVKVVLPSPEGEDAAIIATLDRGSFFGELALLDGADHSATAIAVEATQALVLRREPFEHLVEDEPALRRARAARSGISSWSRSSRIRPRATRSCTSRFTVCRVPPIMAARSDWV